MQFQIIPKQEHIPDFPSKDMKLKHILYYMCYDDMEYEEDEITEDIIAKVLREIPEGIEVYLSLNPFGEEDWLEVLCDGEWLALGYMVDNECYYSYNKDFEGTKELSPLESGGQSPVEKYLAIKDIDAGIKAVEYFIRTGQLYPGIDWARQMD